MNTIYSLFGELDAVPDLLHSFSTRSGGLSNGIFTSLNLGLTTMDDTDIVNKNREIYFKKLGISEDRIAVPVQVHSTNVQIISQPGTYTDCDALITLEKNVYLTVQTADCFPVFIIDKVNKIVALVHSGWRGTAGNIIGHTLKKMKTEFNCNPADMISAIGPGIQQKCYQVDKITAAQFSNKHTLPDGSNHYLLNVQSAIVDQIKEEGISIKNIIIDGRCTHCEKDTFYSYRRDGAQSGRMMGVLGFKN